MKKIWYYSLRVYVTFGLKLFYREIKVAGRENIPPDEAVIFLPNHQNTFIDALMIACTNQRESYYLARADVFNRPLLRWLMSTFNLYPIYRIRDGVGNLSRNEEIFRICYNALKNKKGVMIHPEGNHSLLKRVRPLSKGFSRIALGAIETYPGLKVKMIPVGINYDKPTAMGSRVSVYYGEAIDAADFSTDNQSVQELKELVEKQLQELSVHISKEQNHHEIYRKLKKDDVDLTDPAGANAYIRGERLFPRIIQENGLPFWYYMFLPLAAMVCWPVILIWKMLKPKIKDPAFYGALKFSLGLFLCPVFIILFSFIAALLWGWWIFPIVLILSIISLPSLALLEGDEDHIISG